MSLRDTAFWHRVDLEEEELRKTLSLEFSPDKDGVKSFGVSASDGSVAGAAWGKSHGEAANNLYWQLAITRAREVLKMDASTPTPPMPEKRPDQLLRARNVAQRLPR